MSIGGLTCVRACAAPPQELNHLQSLLAGTYQQLNVVSTQLLQAQTGLKQAANMLSCATKVILMMMQFQHHLSDEVRARPGAAAPVCAPRASLSGSKVVVCCEPFFVVSSSVRDQAFEVLSSYLSPVVHDTDEQGWEEVTDCSLTSMLRSALSKKDMANNIVQLEAVSEMPDDAQRLQKVRADDSSCTASHTCRRHRSSHTHTHRLLLAAHRYSCHPPSRFVSSSCTYSYDAYPYAWWWRGVACLLSHSTLH